MQWGGYNKESVNILCNLIKEAGTVTNNKKVIYYNCPIAFDTETTSFMRGEEKAACMYIWMVAVKDVCVYGRKWEEFQELIYNMQVELGLNKDTRIIIYVHNLSFDFQFICKRFEWDNVFAIKDRKVIYCLTEGVEFRCSYLLSGLSLEKVGENLTRYKRGKKVGQLNYGLIRHSETPLTESEIEYCVYDVFVITAYIQECIEKDGNIIRIPLTVTGYVRNYCRNKCLYAGPHHQRNRHYYKLMKSLQITGIPEYKQLKRAFQGGFTHANSWYARRTLNDVTSYDIISSYPYTMVSEGFPMSTAELLPDSRVNDDKELDFLLWGYCCLFDVEFRNIYAIKHHEHTISASKCVIEGNFIKDNGRIVSADILRTTVTEIDYKIIKEYYTWDSKEIYNFRRYEKEYLPTEFVTAILKLYEDKTLLKGEEGKEEEYLKGKGMLNSAYGMAVTDLAREDFVFNGRWLEDEEKQEFLIRKLIEKHNLKGDEELDEDDIIEQFKENPEEWENYKLQRAIDKYNRSVTRFLFYPWGVWITAYARRNLFRAISEYEGDYIYSDTDSIKALHAEKHTDFIESYNREVREKLEKAMKYHCIDFSKCEPESTKDGKKLIGAWENDGSYKHFKTVGAKRYLLQKQNGKIQLTVSGLNKKLAVPYMLEKYGESGIFEAFDDELYIPEEHTGKLTHTYIDYEQSGELTDYLGNVGFYHELSSVHLAPQDYSMGLKEYIKFLEGVKNDE